jgi:AbrB family transcriptional regulator (stage V sporulation protein T)
MKATGIIRKIDDLGRIVIPKEIRKTLKIREGDTLEIYVEKNGEIVLKRYAPFGDVIDRINVLVETISKHIGCNVIVTDSKTVIASQGYLANKYNGKDISEELLDKLEERSIYGIKGEKGIPIIEGQEEYIKLKEIVAPIIIEGTVVGAVVFLSTDERKAWNESEIKLLKIVTDYITKQME